jgi:hypothetical protein
LAKRHRSGVQLVEQDLFPHSLYSLTNHLRLHEDEISSGVIDWEQCARELLSDIGLARTLQRFVHLPIPLPNALLNAFGGSSSVQQNFIIARLLRTTRHPLAFLQIGHVIASSGAIEGGHANKARMLIDQALGTLEGQQAWELFESILKWSFEVLGSLAKFREMHPTLRLVFSWLHAGRLSDVFLVGGMSANGAGEAFMALNRSYGLELGAWNSTLWNDCSHPRFAGRVPTLMASLGAIITRLPEEIGATLRRESIHGLGGESEVDPSTAMLLRDTMLMRNSIGSFLSGSCGSSARDAMAPGLASRLEFHEPREIWKALIARLETDAGDPALWKALDFVLDDLPIDADSETRLRAIVSSQDFAAMVRSAPGNNIHIVRFAANRVRHCKDESYSKVLDRFVNERLSILSKTESGIVAHSDLTPLLGSFIGFSIVPGNEIATYTRFHGLLAETIRRWPSLARFLGRPNWCWPNRWPMVRQAGYWRFELVRRSLS